METKPPSRSCYINPVTVKKLKSFLKKYPYFPIHMVAYGHNCRYDDGTIIGASNFDNTVMINTVAVLENNDRKGFKSLCFANVPKGKTFEEMIQESNTKANDNKFSAKILFTSSDVLLAKDIVPVLDDLNDNMPLTIPYDGSDGIITGFNPVGEGSVVYSDSLMKSNKTLYQLYLLFAPIPERSMRSYYYINSDISKLPFKVFDWDCLSI